MCQPCPRYPEAATSKRGPVPRSKNVAGHSGVSKVATDSLKVRCCTFLSVAGRMSVISAYCICHAKALTSVSLGLCNLGYSPSGPGPLCHGKKVHKMGGKIRIKKRASYLRERGEGMSITEAPDVTVAGSSPWCCCGRQRKTSFGRDRGTQKGGDTT